MPILNQNKMNGRPLVEFLPEDRRQPEVSRDLGPEEVDRILRAANSGDQAEQAKLAAEILEKDWDIAQAVRTRVAAVIGTPWELEPADDSPRAAEVAAFVRQTLLDARGDDDLGLTGFNRLLADMLNSYLPGFSVNEVVWTPGGRGIVGFQFIPQQHFSFAEGARPRLRGRDRRTTHELPARRFVVHRYSHRPGDPARGGMIRPLAWLYACKRLVLLDMIRYVEKFGMPFLLAKLDRHVWETERHRVAQMIRRFGSDGGGVFSDGVDIELVSNSWSQGQGRLFLEVMDYFERAINRLVLGQTSTADSRFSNRSTAAVHELVRQDLRLDDCAALATTVGGAIIRPLVTFNFGPDTAPPTMVFRTADAPDLERDARVLRHLAAAGYRVRDLSRLHERFGYEFERSGDDGHTEDNRRPAVGSHIEEHRRPAVGSHIEEHRRPAVGSHTEGDGGKVAEVTHA